MLKFVPIAAMATMAVHAWQHPTAEDAARYARTLVSRESLANVNSVYQQDDVAGLPTSFVEYYADCGPHFEGNPVLLAIDMSTSFSNIAQGSNATLSIRVGDHPMNEHVNPKYPGSRPSSVAGSPRVNLRGEFVNVTMEELPQLEACFLKRHPDSRWWLPGNPIHSSHFVKFEVDSVYFLGGFGDTGYIGEIPIELYKNATILPRDRRGLVSGGNAPPPDDDDHMMHGPEMEDEVDTPQKHDWMDSLMDFFGLKSKHHRKHHKGKHHKGKHHRRPHKDMNEDEPQDERKHHEGKHHDDLDDESEEQVVHHLGLRLPESSPDKIMRLVIQED